MSLPVSKTPVAIECCSSQRIIIITSGLFLLVLSPVHSQIPSPTQTPVQGNPRTLNDYGEPASRGDAIASPTTAPRSPRRNGREGFTPVPRPQRTDNTPYLLTPTPASPRYSTASPITSTPRPRRHDTANPVTPTPSRRRDDAAILVSPTQPPRRSSTASPITPRPPRRDNPTTFMTPTPPPGEYNTTSPTSPTPRLPRRYNTPNLITPIPPPRRQATAYPVTPTPLPNTEDMTSEVTPTRPPRRYTPRPITPTPPPPRYETPSPATPTRPPPVNITASPTIPSRPPVPDITPGPIRRFPFPIPNVATSSTIPPWLPPRRDYTARPFETPSRRFTPETLNEFHTPPVRRDAVASPSVQPPIDITASLANRVILNATPSRPEVDQTVRFELRFQRPPPRVPNIQYGFNFADGSPVEWTAVPRTIHLYSAAGTYEPSVEVRVGARVLDLPKIVGPTLEVVQQSSPTPTTTETPAPITPSPTSTFTPTATAAPGATSFVSPTTPPSVSATTPPSLPSPKMPWLYIVIGFFGVAVLACLAYAKSKLKGAIAARPTFHAHSDWNTPRTPPPNVAIKYQLRFNSNRSASQDRVETHGASLIQKREIL